MPNNWTETMARRRAGLEPGFLGAGESHEHYEARMNPPAKKAAAKKAPAKKATAKKAR